MKYYFLILIFALCSCSTKEVRTRTSDKSLRTMIDPDSIDPKGYVAIQNALVASGKWYVVDRAQGYKAVLKEQDRQHVEKSNRFSDSNKYAHFGELYGVGSIIVPHAQCASNPSTNNVLWGIAHLATLGIFYNNYVCSQFIELIDTNTGMLIASIRNEYKTDVPLSEQTDWTDAVNKLNDDYPKYFEIITKSQRLEMYEAESKERAQRLRESGIGE